MCPLGFLLRFTGACVPWDSVSRNTKQAANGVIMAEHLIYFTLTDVPEPLTGIQTNDDPDGILQALRDHINSGKPESIDVNAVDSRGTYTNTVVIRLAKVAAVRVNRNVRSDRVKLTVTTSTEKSEDIKKKSVKKAARKKKT
jgi:hypothetical protein